MHEFIKEIKVVPRIKIVCITRIDAVTQNKLAYRCLNTVYIITHALKEKKKTLSCYIKKYVMQTHHRIYYANARQSCQMVNCFSFALMHLTSLTVSVPCPKTCPRSRKPTSMIFNRVNIPYLSARKISFILIMLQMYILLAS